MSALAAGDLRLLSRSCGLPLHHFRPDFVEGRVRRALDREQVAGIGGLASRLREDTRLRLQFRRSVAVSVSGVNRDPHQFELLEHELLPPLLRDRRALTAWSAGCADGTELESLARVLGRLGGLDHARLLGSDLLAENVALARRAAARPQLRFEQRDVVSEGAPRGGFAVVLCRNVGIYLAPRARRVLHETLAASLRARGILLLGRSERLLDPGVLGLEPVGPSAYRRPR